MVAAMTERDDWQKVFLYYGDYLVSEMSECFIDLSDSALPFIPHITHHIPFHPVGPGQVRLHRYSTVDNRRRPTTGHFEATAFVEKVPRLINLKT